MVDMFLAEIIGFTSMGIMLVVGIGLSAWKGEFNPNHNQCSNSCCNPDHWNPEDKAKLSPEQYKMMKETIERGKIYE